jgi:cyclopropane-fatty-acyl-phospholipid synthase
MFRLGFNPVSFYYCYSHTEQLVCLLAEVNNTFQERHLYPLLPPPSGLSDTSFHATSEKTFHVSPFITREGVYSFDIGPLGDRWEISINLDQYNRRVLSSRLVGTAHPFNSQTLLRGLGTHSVTRLMTLPRIHKQAALLYLGKKASFIPKAPPISDRTISVKRPGFLNARAWTLIERLLDHITEGGLTFRLPNGDRKHFGSADSPTQEEIWIHDFRVFRKTILGGDVAFGEAYMEGMWDSGNLPGVIALFLRNRDNLADLRLPMARLVECANANRHRFRRNTPAKSRVNIADHYDLGDCFFRTFLDSTMTYSCAYFENEDSTLEEAQKAKMQRIIAKADFHSDDEVLEIGCGWGSLVAEILKTTSCRVTAVTLSDNQYRYAKELFAHGTEEGQVQILRSDYRELRGNSLYDKIVSIEMLEALGHQYLGTFFQVCNRLLKEHGRIVLQVITMPDKYYDSYRKGCDWIQKHIFPGGFLPSMGEIERAIQENTSFTIDDVEDIGPHYTRTLSEWRDRFTENRERVGELGFSEVFRKFIYYFSYCEAAFATKTLGVQQIVLSR